VSFENWVKNSWLDEQPSDREEIGRLLAIADARLADYQKAVKARIVDRRATGSGLRRGTNFRHSCVARSRIPGRAGY
jgi:hypothetical protein